MLLIYGTDCMIYWVWYYVAWLCVVGWCSVVLCLVWMVTALLGVVPDVHG